MRLRMNVKDGSTCNTNENLKVYCTCTTCMCSTRYSSACSPIVNDRFSIKSPFTSLLSIFLLTWIRMMIRYLKTPSCDKHIPT